MQVISATLLVAVDIETEWWSYRVHIDGTVEARCPDEPEWFLIQQHDLDGEDFIFDDLLKIASKEFKSLVKLPISNSH